MDEHIANLTVKQIDPPPVLLRPVDRLAVEYVELRDSIATRGFLDSISVRQVGDRYQVIDGMHRLSCAIDLAFPTIPAIIKQDVSDEELLLCQMEGNACRRETAPVDFAKQIRRVTTLHPTITIGDLSARLHKSAAWIKNQLDLLQLPAELQTQVDRGEIPLGNAYMLAKLPSPKLFVEQAINLTCAEFRRIAAQEIKRFTERIRQGRLDRTFSNNFEPTPYLRPLKHVLFEYETRCDGPRVLVQEDCKNPVDGFYAALKWVLNLDASGVEEQKKRFFNKFRKKDE